MMKVLCCCNPSNELGEAPEGLGFPTREWEDEVGNIGLAYPSDDIIWDKVPGFRVAEPDKRGAGTKTWRKTWRK